LSSVNLLIENQRNQTGKIWVIFLMVPIYFGMIMIFWN